MLILKTIGVFFATALVILALSGVVVAVVAAVRLAGGGDGAEVAAVFITVTATVIAGSYFVANLDL